MDVEDIETVRRVDRNYSPAISAVHVTLDHSPYQGMTG